VSSTKAFHGVVAPALLVELPTALAVASNPDPDVWEECWKTDLDAVGARSLHPVIDRIQLKVVEATWKVHWLWEILPTTSWVPHYFENLVTQKRLSHIE
jgi:hypothetical protein